MRCLLKMLPIPQGGIPAAGLKLQYYVFLKAGELIHPVQHKFSFPSNNHQPLINELFIVTKIVTRHRQSNNKMQR